jgi:hypothetical protein
LPATPVTETATRPPASASLEPSVWQPDPTTGVTTIPVQVLTTSDPLQTGGRDYDAAVAQLEGMGLDAHALERLKRGIPPQVTRESYNADLALRTRLMKDRDFVDRFLKSDANAVAIMTSLNYRIAAEIVDD